MPKIRKIEPAVPILPKRKRVAAYARVSMESERLMHSLAAQISYYSELIQKNPEWEYAGVYADSFVSGTDTVRRKEFQRLIADCDAGLIDIVLCKSISRFARNTVDLLETVRHLKSLGIEVRFEKEKINSLSGDGELMLTIIASFADQESISLSENLKWAIQKKFERGEPWGQACYGYAKVGNDYIVNEEEAVFIRRIYADFLADVPMNQTAVWLRDNGCQCTTKQFVKSVLTNITYIGDLLLQRHFSPKVRRMRKNNGEMPKFHVHGHHPAIIPVDVFEQAQKKMQSLLAYNPEAHRIGRVSCFSSKITCAVCGNHYVSYGGGSWACYAKIISRKKVCQNGNLSVELLEKLCTDVIGGFSEKAFVSTVHNLLIHPDGKVIFTFYDGSTKEGTVHFYQPEDRKHLDPHTRIYGYTRIGDTYIICEEEAEAVRMIYEDYLNGVTISEISRKMERLGYQTSRGKFSRKTVLNYLSNVFYIGTRIYPAAYSGTRKDEIAENDHPAIITREQFEKARKRREQYVSRNQNTSNDQPLHSSAD